jgi:hypothetical protein
MFGQQVVHIVTGVVAKIVAKASDGIQGHPSLFTPTGAQAEADVQEGLAVLASGIKVLHQADQASAVEVAELRLDIAPGRYAPLGRCHQ